MKAIGTIEIKDKTYKYSFKMKARRLFMELYGLKYMDEYQEKVQSMFPENEEEKTSLEGWYVFANILLTAIQAEVENPVEFTADDVLDAVIDDQNKLNEIMKVINYNQEQPEKNSSGGSGKSKVGK